MAQKVPVNKFEWIEDTSKINEDFIKNYNEESDERYFAEVGVQYPELYYGKSMIPNWFFQEKYLNTKLKYYDNKNKIYF